MGNAGFKKFSQVSIVYVIIAYTPPSALKVTVYTVGMHPNNQIFVFPIPVPIKAKWFVIGYIILEIVQGWGVGDGIAHFAHVGGMLWGWALLYYWKNNRKIWF